MFHFVVERARHTQHLFVDELWHAVDDTKLIESNKNITFNILNMGDETLVEQNKRWVADGSPSNISVNTIFDVNFVHGAVQTAHLVRTKSTNEVYCDKCQYLVVVMTTWELKFEWNTCVRALCAGFNTHIRLLMCLRDCVTVCLPSVFRTYYFLISLMNKFQNVFFFFGCGVTTMTTTRYIILTNNTHIYNLLYLERDHVVEAVTWLAIVCLYSYVSVACVSLGVSLSTAVWSTAPQNCQDEK